MDQRATAMQLLLSVVLIVLLIQLWLVTAALEDTMAGADVLQLPTFIASGACFFANLGLLKYLYDLDRTP